jgi:hypothetical protein
MEANGHLSTVSKCSKSILRKNRVRNDIYIYIIIIFRWGENGFYLAKATEKWTGTT